MPDQQYWREVGKATHYPPKERKRAEEQALKAWKRREKKAPNGKRKQTSKLASVVGAVSKVAKAAKGISKDMAGAIAYEMSPPKKKRIKTKTPKKRTYKEKATKVAPTEIRIVLQTAGTHQHKKPRKNKKSMKQPQSFTVKPNWM